MTDELVERVARAIIANTCWLLVEEAEQIANAALAALRKTHHLIPKDQEPVGWIMSDGKGGWLTHSPYKTMHTDTPLGFAVLQEKG